MPRLQAIAAITLPVGTVAAVRAPPRRTSVTGGERLVFGELLDPDREGVGGNETGAEERHDREEHRRVAGRLDGVRGEPPQVDRQPDQGDREQHGDAQRPPKPSERVDGRPEAECDRHREDDRDAEQGLDEAGEDVSDEHG